MERPKRLSAAFVRSLKVPGRYGDGRGGHGLSLLVKRTRAGGVSKSWSQRVRLNDKPTNIGLGAFPIVSLAEARAAALANRRALAQGIDPRTKRFVAAAPTGLTERAAILGLANGHDLLDERRRRIHMAIADKIDANPGLLGKAKANLKRWQRQRGHMERGYVEWAAILERPWHEIAAVLRSKSEHAIRLRQCSPFAAFFPSANGCASMKRSELEHVIRAAAAILDVEDIVVVGSQSILGRYPDAPRELLESCEADIYPRGDPPRSAIIDAVIGEESRFHETFGYYVDGVDEKTSVLPPDWEQRLVRVANENTRGAVGWCLDPEDLALAKHVAGRDKDIRFTQALVRHGMVDRATLLERLDSMELPAEKRAVITGRIAAQFAAAREQSDVIDL